MAGRLLNNEFGKDEEGNGHGLSLKLLLKHLSEGIEETTKP
jgi:hypothetical protein